jgi:hypothetical protein
VKLTNPNDWLEITIKFRGKCCECDKEITSGQALWSKSTKAVKHLNCPSRNVDNNKTIASTSLEENATHDPRKKEFATAKQRRSLQQTIELKCFICGNKTKSISNDNNDSVDYIEYYNDKSHHAYICQSCLKREDVYEAYQQSFLQTINKYLK